MPWPMLVLPVAYVVFVIAVVGASEIKDAAHRKEAKCEGSCKCGAVHLVEGEYARDKGPWSHTRSGCYA